MSKELKKREDRGGNLKEISRELDDMARDFEAKVMMPWFPVSMMPWRRPMMAPRIDLNDHGDHYEVFIEVPGVQKDAVQVHMTKTSLEVSAELEEEKVEGNESIVRERNHEEVYRHLTFPEEVNPDEAEAIVSNGLLTVKVPKMHKVEKKRKIEVK